VLTDETLPRVSKCKYLRHISTEDLSDNDDTSRQYKRIYAQGNALTGKFYIYTESVKCTTALHYIHASCDVTIEQSELENCVYPTIMYLDCYPMNLEIMVPVICLCQQAYLHVQC